MEQVISFSDSDLKDVQLPYNDPLVVTLRIGNYDVERILIDQGSFAKVMYQDLYTKLGIGEAEVFSFMSPIFGFSREPVVPLGKVILPVLAGPVNLQTEFIIINASSPYKAIMGRDWLHRMRAIPSTLHQKLRFPKRRGHRAKWGSGHSKTMCFDLGQTERYQRERKTQRLMTITVLRT